METLPASSGSEDVLGEAAERVISDRLANPKPGDDPLVLARLRAALDRRKAAALQAASAQQDYQRAAQAARTDAEKKAAKRENFIRQQREIDPTFDLDEAIRRSHEHGREQAAFRKKMEEHERAAADRWIERSEMPRRKRRRQTYVWRRYSEGGPGLQEYRPGALGVPYDLW